MNRRESKKKRILPGIIIAAFLASIATFFILLNVERNALKDFETVTVWVTTCELAEGMEMTKMGIGECLTQMEIDKNKVPAKRVESAETLINKYTELNIPQGTILIETMFSDDESFRMNINNPVIAGCKGDDLFQLVSGVLRKGDLVHVYMVNKEMGETYMLWENVLVYQVFDASGNLIPPEDILTPAARVNLLIEEGYTEQFYNELDKGSLRLVKVWD